LIKAYARNDDRFAIEEVESRFTNKMPISDVTLKIVINNQIVAELQLTIQTNAATYSFAHKIYELQRTKVFSKLKIIHNYFEESDDDFNQLASKALNILASKSMVGLEEIKSINNFFKLDSVHPKTLFSIFCEVFH
jgi:hypothetical protein